MGVPAFVKHKRKRDEVPTFVKKYLKDPTLLKLSWHGKRLPKCGKVTNRNAVAVKPPLVPKAVVELSELVVELPVKKFLLLPALDASLRYSERAAIESCVLEVHPVS